MDKERLNGLLDYYKVLSNAGDGYRLNDVADEIERELGMNQLVCGGSSGFVGVNIACGPPNEN